MPLKRSGVIAGSILAITALVAMLGGRIFAARTARQLAQIADGIHQDSDASTADLLSGENPPIEIQRVAEAISEALTKARWEQERNSLLIAGIAHELRSPIQNLLGETEVLLMRARTPEEYRAVLESHTDEIQDLAREVDNLVTLCAHSSNQESSAWETFDLGHEIALRLPRELERAKRREVDIQLDLDGDLNMVGDREALLLMVRNLVGNAVSYSGPKTTVRVSAKSQDGQVLLGVADQGPGVPAQHRARIFEPFQRGADRPGVRSGFGLGLALSREAVLAQGGALTVCDSETGGALFEARMPMVAPARPGPAASKG
jgi:signal transduction histidine kinase